MISVVTMNEPTKALFSSVPVKNFKFKLFCPRNAQLFAENRTQSFVLPTCSSLKIFCRKFAARTPKTRKQQDQMICKKVRALVKILLKNNTVLRETNTN